MRVRSTLQAVGIAALMFATADAALRRPAVQARQMMSTQDDYDCTPGNCVMGGEFDCMCANTTAPGGIPANRVPMMVLLTWDDAVTGEAFDKTSAIANGIRSANNCPLRSTYYVSTEYTQFDKIHTLYSAGHEIAVHTITHTTGYSSSNQKWEDEIVGCKLTLSKFGAVPEKEIRGFRAPFLQYSEGSMRALFKHRFEYESSISESGQQGRDYGSLLSTSMAQKIWPYTITRGMGQRCEFVHGNCVRDWSFPGLWGVPMWTIDDASGNVLNSMDNTNFEDLKRNFLAKYNGNRSPFGVFLHSGRVTIEAVRAFLEWAATQDDVYFVTNHQLIEWMRNPVDIDGAADFFGCGDIPDIANPGTGAPGCEQKYACNANGIYWHGCTPCTSLWPKPNNFRTVLCPNTAAWCDPNTEDCVCSNQGQPLPSATPSPTASASPSVGSLPTPTATATAAVPGSAQQCTGCFGSSSGPCKAPNTVCYDLSSTGQCPSGSSPCGPAPSPSGTPTPSTSAIPPSASPTPSTSPSVGASPSPSPSKAVVLPSPSSSKAPVAPSGQCTGCFGSSSGPCKAANTVCYDLSSTGQCPSGSSPCGAGPLPSAAASPAAPSASSSPGSAPRASATPSSVPVSGGACSGCWFGTSGPCKGSNTVCYGYFPGTTVCPGGTILCSASGSAAGGQASGSSSSMSSANLASLFGGVSVDTAVTNLAGEASAQCIGCTHGISGPCQHADGTCSPLDASGSCPAPAVLCASLTGTTTTDPDTGSPVWTASPMGRVEVSLHLGGLELSDLTTSVRTTLRQGLAAIWAVEAADIMIASLESGRFEGSFHGSSGVYARIVVFIKAEEEVGKMYRSATAVRDQIMATSSERVLAETLYAMVYARGYMVHIPVMAPPSTSAEVAAAWSALVAGGSASAGSGGGASAVDSGASETVGSDTGSDSSSTGSNSPSTLLVVGVGVVCAVAGVIVGAAIRRRRPSATSTPTTVIHVAEATMSPHAAQPGSTDTSGVEAADPVAALMNQYDAKQESLRPAKMTRGERPTAPQFPLQGDVSAANNQPLPGTLV